MAKKDGKKSAKQPSLRERLLKVEEDQRRLEAELEESQLRVNELVDGRDKHVRWFNQQIRDIAAMLRTMGERAIIIHELQEQAELRLDKHEERLTNCEERQAQHEKWQAEMEKLLGKISKQQAENTSKLNALLDYEKRYRGNGQNGKRSSK